MQQGSGILSGGSQPHEHLYIAGTPQLPALAPTRWSGPKIKSFPLEICEQAGGTACKWEAIIYPFIFKAGRGPHQTPESQEIVHGVASRNRFFDKAAQPNAAETDFGSCGSSTLAPIIFHPVELTEGDARSVPPCIKRIPPPASLMYAAFQTLEPLYPAMSRVDDLFLTRIEPDETLNDDFLMTPEFNGDLAEPSPSAPSSFPLVFSLDL